MPRGCARGVTDQVLRSVFARRTDQCLVTGFGRLTQPPPLQTIASVKRDIAAQLHDEATRLARLWAIPSLPARVTLRLNRRLTTTVARYRRDTRTIEVGVRFLTLRARRSEVLAHELAHAAVHIRHGHDAQVHGAEWQALVKAAGVAARARMPVTRRVAAPKRRAGSSRYEHRCAVCQMVRTAKRPVTAWRCRQCLASGLDGALDISRTAATR